MNDPLDRIERSVLRMIVRWTAVGTTIAIPIATVSMIFIAGVMTLWGKEIINFLQLADKPSIDRIETKVDNNRKDFVAEIANVRRDITDVESTIKKLNRPENIVIYRLKPRLVKESCKPGTICSLALLVERNPRAMSCEVIPNKTLLVIRAEGIDYLAAAEVSRAATNLTTTATVIEPSFRIPATVPNGTHEAVIRSFYSNCPWQDDNDPVIIQDSPIFNIRIKS